MSPVPRNPTAVRRTGKRVHMSLPRDEHAEGVKDAKARAMSFTAHVRALLRQWRKEHKR